MNEKLGTNYHDRLVNFVRYAQESNLMCTGAMTDPNSDQGLPLWKHPDSDEYMYVVDRSDAGIVVRGITIHQTGEVNSHEIIIIPPTGLELADTEYALFFLFHPIHQTLYISSIARQTTRVRLMVAWIKVPSRMVLWEERRWLCSKMSFSPRSGDLCLVNRHSQRNLWRYSPPIIFRTTADTNRVLQKS